MESPKKSEGFKKRGNLSEPYKLTDLPEGFENLEINSPTVLHKGHFTFYNDKTERFESFKINSPTVLNNNYHKHLQDYIRHCNNEKTKKKSIRVLNNYFILCKS